MASTITDLINLANFGMGVYDRFSDDNPKNQAKAAAQLFNDTYLKAANAKDADAAHRVITEYDNGLAGYSRLDQAAKDKSRESLINSVYKRLSKEDQTKLDRLLETRTETKLRSAREGLASFLTQFDDRNETVSPADPTEDSPFAPNANAKPVMQRVPGRAVTLADNEEYRNRQIEAGVKEPRDLFPAIKGRAEAQEAEAKTKGVVTPWTPELVQSFIMGAQKGDFTPALVNIAQMPAGKQRDDAMALVEKGQKHFLDSLKNEQAQTEWKTKFEEEKRQFGITSSETARHNRTSEGISAGNLGVAQQREARESAKDAREAAATTTADEGRLDSINDTKKVIESAKGLVGPSTAGLGGMRAFMPGSDARTLRSQLTNIQSFFTIDKLNQMKSASKTGASGFGALSEKELALLNNATVMLDQKLDPKVLKDNLDTALGLLNRYEKYIAKKNVPGSSANTVIRDYTQVGR